MIRYRLDDVVARVDAGRRNFVVCHQLVARRPPQRGFGLLELTVGLAVGGAAVAAAATLLMALSTRADAINAAALAIDREANGERLLRLLTRSLDARTDSAALRGDAMSMDLRTWCETALGWPEPCRVRLAFRQNNGTRQLVVERLDHAERDETQVHPPSTRAHRAGEKRRAVGGVAVLRDALGSGHFLYLVDASEGGTWSDAWKLITHPPAVAAVLDGDTLILPF